MAKRSNIQLKKTTKSTTAPSYLDILITIENRKYSTSLCDSFQFDIVNFPDMSSNIPSKQHIECIFPNLYIYNLMRHIIHSQKC